MLSSVRENYEQQLQHERTAREKAHQEMFDTLAVEKFRACVQTMPERIKQLIAAKGGQLKKNYYAPPCCGLIG